MKPMIELRVTARECWDTGSGSFRKIRSYRPVLNLERYPGASGEIRFPVYEEWDDASDEEHVRQRINAVAGAFDTLRQIAETTDSEIREAGE